MHQQCNDPSLYLALSLELSPRFGIPCFCQVARLAPVPRPCRARFLLTLVTTDTGFLNSATRPIVALLAVYPLESSLVLQARVLQVFATQFPPRWFSWVVPASTKWYAWFLCGRLCLPQSWIFATQPPSRWYAWFSCNSVVPAAVLNYNSKSSNSVTTPPGHQQCNDPLYLLPLGCSPRFGMLASVRLYASK